MIRSKTASVGHQRDVHEDHVGNAFRKKLSVLRDPNPQGLWHQFYTAPVLALLALELDQLTKLLVRQTMELGESIPHEARLRITYVVNPGILFGTPASPTVSLALPIGMILVSLGLYWVFRRSHSRVLSIGTGLFLGGTSGNLLDRIIQGRVTDFIEVVSSGGRTVFNVADLCVIAGIIFIEAFLIRLVVKIIRERGLRYNPLKASIVRMIRSRGSRKKD